MKQSMVLKTMLFLAAITSSDSVGAHVHITTVRLPERAGLWDQWRTIVKGQVTNAIVAVSSNTQFLYDIWGLWVPTSASIINFWSTPTEIRYWAWVAAVPMGAILWVLWETMLSNQFLEVFLFPNNMYFWEYGCRVMMRYGAVTGKHMWATRNTASVSAMAVYSQMHNLVMPQLYYFDKAMKMMRPNDWDYTWTKMISAQLPAFYINQNMSVESYWEECSLFMPMPQKFINTVRELYAVTEEEQDIPNL